MGWTTVKKQTARVLVFGLFLVSLRVVGHGGVGLASIESGHLQIDHESVSGTLTQVPLQILLEQFHQQRGIDYQASQAILTKAVSVELPRVSVREALSKILAPWDYALQADAAGHIRKIFVVRKIVPGGAEAQSIKANAGQRLSANTRRGRRRSRPLLAEPSGTLYETGSDSSEAMRPSQPAIAPVFPAQAGESPRAAMREVGMGHLSPTSYQEMDIDDVSEAEAQGILQSFNIPDGGATDEASYPEMAIRHMSGEEKAAILQAFPLPQDGAGDGGAYSGMEIRHISEADAHDLR